MKKIALLALLWPGLLAAQQRAVAPNVLVLGASADAAACGVDVLDANPAGTIATCGSRTAKIRGIFPPTVAVGGFSDGPHSSVWSHRQDFIDGFDEDWDFSAIPASERREILDAISDEGWTSGGYLTLPLVILQLGRFSFSAVKTFQADGTLPRDVAELVLEGRNAERFGYNVDSFDLSVLGVSAYTLGYAHPLARGWTVGASASVYTGTVNGYYDARPVRINLADESAELDIVGGFAGGALIDGSPFDFRKPDGLGYSVDLGTRYTTHGFTAAFAVENLASTMSWPERTIRITTRVRAGLDGSVNTEAVRDTFETTVPETDGLRSNLDAYSPARRLRTAVAYELGVATVGYGRVDETGTGKLLSVGDGWDAGLSLHPWRFLDIQGSVGEWRGERTLGAGLTLATRSFLLQGALKQSDTGSHVAFSIGLSQ